MINFFLFKIMNTLYDIVEYHADKSKFDLLQEFKKFEVRVYIIGAKKYINCKDLLKYQQLIVNICPAQFKFTYNNIEIDYNKDVYIFMQTNDIANNNTRNISFINNNPSGVIILRPKLQNIYYNFKLKKCIKYNNNSFILNKNYEQYIMELNVHDRNHNGLLFNIKQLFDKLSIIDNLLQTISIKRIELNTNEYIDDKFDNFNDHLDGCNLNHDVLMHQLNIQHIEFKLRIGNNIKEIKLLKEQNRNLQLEIHYLKLDSEKNRPNIDYESIKKRNNSLNKEFKRIYKLTKMKHNF